MGSNGAPGAGRNASDQTPRPSREAGIVASRITPGVAGRVVAGSMNLRCPALRRTSTGAAGGASASGQVEDEPDLVALAVGEAGDDLDGLDRGHVQTPCMATSPARR